MPSVKELSEQARYIYHDCPRLFAWKQEYRPFICPYNKLLTYIEHKPRVLDVGCGGGLFLFLLAKNQLISEGTGIDNSAHAIRHANSVAATRMARFPLTFIARNALDSWPEKPVDLVSIIDVVHHIAPSHQKEVFRRAAGCLASTDRGKILYKDIALQPRWRRLANTLHDLLLARQLVNYVSQAEVIRWMEDLGFDAQKQQSVNLAWYRHDIVLFRRRKW
jgi:cyclopropane fatty-acyl-phospholipid synthase-like methyltransferase